MSMETISKETGISIITIKWFAGRLGGKG
jgi:hypothetical protein